MGARTHPHAAERATGGASAPYAEGVKRWEVGFVLVVLAVLLILMVLGVIGSFVAQWFS